MIERKSTEAAHFGAPRRPNIAGRRPAPVPHPERFGPAVGAATLRAPDAGGRAGRATIGRTTRLSVGRDQLLSIIEIALDPLVLVGSLWSVTLALQGQIGAHIVILSVVVFSLTFPGASRLTMSPWRIVRHIGLSWATLSALLLVFGYASRYLEYFDHDVLLTWLWVAPVTQLAAQFLLQAGAPAIRRLQGPGRRAVVAGMNEQGMDLALRIADDPYANVRMLGFFDDREAKRLDKRDNHILLGRIADLPAYAKRHHVDVIYLSLPMASQSRILNLLEALRDTTSSIYFVPDTFVTDLIQGRMDAVGGIPVVSVCETPFTGLVGLLKRTSDVLLASAAVVLIAPLLLAIGAGVKLSSPGPVIFKQRRYGLDGHEIIVYKFRSMRAQEDGSEIIQARRGDPRLTRFGAFLRRTSLDELPQFVNVLQGRMSIVGPRPHAVAHNEMYRKLIKGYMLRHKVRPGITGWAQVNGFRGETETLEKMKARIECDLEYLRNWSLRLDLFIMAKTVWVIVKNDSAY
jgi:putative colanic acid biosynthesis UDP-glucose lipid carrier transferase